MCKWQNKISENDFIKFKNYTYGHRYLNKTVKVNSPKDFVNTMKSSYVFVNRLHRKKLLKCKYLKFQKN